MVIVDYLKKGKIAYIKINRPEAMNALNLAVKNGLIRAFENVRDDNDIRVAVITGAGDKAFCAGEDIKEMKTHDPEKVKENKDKWGVLRPDTIMKPFIAAVNGYCLGGGLELALCCDIRICSENAVFGLPETGIGVIPGNGATVRLPRFINRSIAVEMLLTGRQLDAGSAFNAGLVSHTVASPELVGKAEEIADSLVVRSPLAVSLTKETILRGPEMDFDDALGMEIEFNRYIRTTDDYLEGQRAFVEKRKPDFKGK